MTRRAILFVVVLLSAAHAFAGTGRILIINNDAAGVGFNDPTPAAPVGGNNGTTRGQQRLNVFLAAAERWQSSIDVNIDIRVSARFAPIAGCTADEGVLGQAGPLEWKRNFPGAPLANTHYPIALANQLTNSDLSPGDDISVRFNADVDNDTCLGTSSWYYGFDGNHGANVDLFVVVLHELAHGLGIAGATGAPEFSGGLPSVFDTNVFDTALGLRWDQMTPEQRRSSVLNTGYLVWDGPEVRNAAARFLKPLTALSVTSPAVVARNYDIGLAQFGAPASVSTTAGSIAIANDAITEYGPSTTDACTAITNPSAIAGRIALVDRGSCTFVMKSRNVQAAGAIGLIVVDNTRETCQAPSMGGTAPDITIPVISISQDDGDKLKAQLNANTTVEAGLRVDPSQLAGASPQGHVRLYAPCTIRPGSSAHHWDVTSDPNLLMEPFIGSDLLHGVDLTQQQLLDIGWSLPPRTGRRVLKK